MKIQNLGAKISSKKLIMYPLVIILMGIFLLPKTAYLSTINSEKLIELTNIERSKAGVGALSANQLLTKAAYDKAESLITAQVFNHTIGDKKFSTWIKNSGYEYSFVGENLAIDFVSSEGAIKAWLDSPTHRKNLLNNKFNEIGIAIIEGKFQGKNTTLVVQIFGTPLKSETITENNSELFELKNSDKLLSEFNIKNENLLTNAQNMSSSSSLLSSDIEIFNPENYLSVLKINSAQADWESNTSSFNYINLFLYFIFITIASIITSLYFYKPVLFNEKNIKK